MPMRQDCLHFESRTYPNGDTVRKCDLDLAPEAPWRCPDDCTGYTRRRVDVNWSYGSLVTPKTPDEPDGEGIAELLDSAEEIINSAGPESWPSSRPRRPTRASSRSSAARAARSAEPSAPGHRRRAGISPTGVGYIPLLGVDGPTVSPADPRGAFGPGILHACCRREPRRSRVAGRSPPTRRRGRQRRRGPTADEEVWRYSRIGDLDLDRYAPLLPQGQAPAGIPAPAREVLDAVGDVAGFVVLCNGRVIETYLDQQWVDQGVYSVGSSMPTTPRPRSASPRRPLDMFGSLNDAFAPEPVLVRIPRGDVSIRRSWSSMDHADGRLVPPPGGAGRREQRG